jgi:hypothetical protein
LATFVPWTSVWTTLQLGARHGELPHDERARLGENCVIAMCGAHGADGCSGDQRAISE